METANTFVDSMKIINYEVEIRFMWKEMDYVFFYRHTLFVITLLHIKTRQKKRI